MTAPDPGLTDLIAADLAKHRFIPDEGDDEFGSCSCLTWRGTNHDRHVALVVKQHTNGRIAEAKQWDGTRASIEEIAQWANANDDPMDDFTLEYCFMSTKPDDVFDVRIWSENDDKTVTPGDWIIRDTAGEFHLCRTAKTTAHTNGRVAELYEQRDNAIDAGLAAIDRAEQAEATIASLRAELEELKND